VGFGGSSVGKVCAYQLYLGNAFASEILENVYIYSFMHSFIHSLIHMASGFSV